MDKPTPKTKPKPPERKPKHSDETKAKIEQHREVVAGMKKSAALRANQRIGLEGLSEIGNDLAIDKPRRKK